MSGRLDWIFFDCFNTLLAEPRSGERFPYLTPLADLPVQYGLYGARAEFLADYARWYESRWPEADAAPTSGREIDEEALRRAAVRPGNALFVGDSLTSDVLAPRRLGMPALHYRSVTRNARAGTGAATLRDGVISHWRDLPAVLSLGT